MIEFIRLQKRNEQAIKSIGYKLEQIHDECTDDKTKVELREFADEFIITIDKMIDRAIEEFKEEYL